MNKIDVLSKISPDMKAALDKDNSLAGDANDTSVGYEKMRENYTKSREYWIEGGPQLKTEDIEIPTEFGSIEARVFYPEDAQADAKLPLIVYSHGGGYVLGNYVTHSRMSRILAQNSKSVVVSLNYSLSPEAKFPQAVVEIANACEYLAEHAQDFGVDKDRIAFAGDSGGANLSAGAFFYLRDKEREVFKSVRALLLFYGWFGLKDSASQRLLGGPWDGLTEADWKFYKELYSKDVKDLEESPYANILLNDMSHDVPAMYIASAEYDPLVDDSKALAAVCREYEIPHKYEMFEGLIHAFLHYTKQLPEANLALEHASEFFREVLETEGK